MVYQFNRSARNPYQFQFHNSNYSTSETILTLDVKTDYTDSFVNTNCLGEIHEVFLSGLDETVECTTDQSIILNRSLTHS
jgi:hypothetical protein